MKNNTVCCTYSHESKYYVPKLQVRSPFLGGNGEGASISCSFSPGHPHRCSDIEQNPAVNAEFGRTHRESIIREECIVFLTRISDEVIYKTNLRWNDLQNENCSHQHGVVVSFWQAHSTKLRCMLLSTTLGEGPSPKEFWSSALRRRVLGFGHSSARLNLHGSSSSKQERKQASLAALHLLVRDFAFARCVMLWSRVHLFEFVLFCFNLFCFNLFHLFLFVWNPFV